MLQRTQGCASSGQLRNLEDAQNGRDDKSRTLYTDQDARGVRSRILNADQDARMLLPNVRR